MLRKDKVLLSLHKLCENMTLKDLQSDKTGFTTIEIANHSSLDRSNTSKELNNLYNEKKVLKISGKPILFLHASIIENLIGRTLNSDEFSINNCNELLKSSKNDSEDIFSTLLGHDSSLKLPIEKAKSAILYPPKGLNTLLIGPTGVGKSTFAETMYKYAVESKIFSSESKFVVFNCAEYAENANLLLSNLFGYVKGSFTGANKDKFGIVAQADGGILFLDEIHRLPPEGQEMLFLLMDKGIYRRLGESDIVHKANVFIVCATTEDIHSSLLGTFLRRIPVTINLPALQDRSLKERLSLIKYFFIIESKYTNATIKVHKDVIKSLLLYDCFGNIGQLKSDIQLMSARAFLNYKTGLKDNIEIDLSLVPDYIYIGLLKLNENRSNLNKLSELDYMLFYEFNGNNLEVEYTKELSKYNIDTSNNGFKYSTEIPYLENDIRSMFINYMEKYSTKLLSISSVTHSDYTSNEIFKVINPKIYYAVEHSLKEAEKISRNKYTKQNYIALSMHISALIENINQDTYNPKYNLYNDKIFLDKDLNIAKIVLSIIENDLQTSLPKDEVKFISMFLNSMYLEPNNQSESIGVIILAHGNSTASSMCDVANSLLGTNHCNAIDMPLDVKVSTILDKTIELVKECDEGKGVLLLTDMGSLIAFGELISEKTKIKTRSIEMVSTPIVLEAVRKSTLPEMTLDELANSLSSLNPYIGRAAIDSTEINYPEKSREYVIITTCITGYGSAMKVADFINSSLKNISKYNINLVPHNIESFKMYKNKFSNTKILAVVGSVDFNVANTPFIHIEELLNGYGLDMLNKIIEGTFNANSITNIKETNLSYNSLIINFMTQNLELLDSVKLFNYVNSSLFTIIELIDENLKSKFKLGYILHCSFMIERCFKNTTFPYNNITELISKNHELYSLIREAFKPTEAYFNILIPDEEIAYIIDMINEYLNK
ncbi:sigma 54-interacting transcriptional regulator [Clostridioides difficile]|nr:sigma 54-interacting transcriptional regulator [Clostridioides difficile]